MNQNEILAKIEDIEKELQELKDMIEDYSKDAEFLQTRVLTTPERQSLEICEKPEKTTDISSMEYDPEEFDIKDGVLYKYLGNSEEVTIPYGVTKIGNHAFKENQTIKKVNLSDTVTEIGEKAFCCCHNLVEVNNAKNVIKIEELAFVDNFNLERIDCNNVKEVFVLGFANCSKLCFTIPKDCKCGGKLSLGAFRNCDNVKESW